MVDCLQESYVTIYFVFRSNILVLDHSVMLGHALHSPNIDTLYQWIHHPVFPYYPIVLHNERGNLLLSYESINQGKSINKSNRSSLENTWSIFLQITRTQSSHSNSSSRRDTASTPLWVGIVIVVDFILFNYTSIFFPIYRNSNFLVFLYHSHSWGMC